MEVMQLTSAWDALTSPICKAVLKTWLNGGTARDQGFFEFIKSLVPLSKIQSALIEAPASKNYEADVEKGMKIDWLGIAPSDALTAGTALALKKSEEHVERWTTNNVLRWLVDVDEKAYLGVFAEKRITGATLLMFSYREADYGSMWKINHKKLQDFIEASLGPRPRADPTTDLRCDSLRRESLAEHILALRTTKPTTKPKEEVTRFGELFRHRNNSPPLLRAAAEPPNLLVDATVRN